MKRKLSVLQKYSIAFVAILSTFTTAHSQDSIDDGTDCTSSINYQDNPNLTTAEKLALMEQAFYDSLNKFELCRKDSQSESNSASSEGDSGAEGGEGGDLSSLADDSLQGTEPPLEQPENAVSPDDSSVERRPNNKQGSSAAVVNGKIPEDIPSAENDDVIAAQIRLAAESETDPDRREKLWNEYRKYKGIK